MEPNDDELSSLTPASEDEPMEPDEEPMEPDEANVLTATELQQKIYQVATNMANYQASANAAAAAAENAAAAAENAAAAAENAAEDIQQACDPGYNN